jgi:hypothetical protein
VELTAREEEEIVDAEGNEIAEEEGLFGPTQPVIIDDHIKLKVDVSGKVLIPGPYQKESRELRSLSYGAALVTKKNDTRSEGST